MIVISLYSVITILLLGNDYFSSSAINLKRNLDLHHDHPDHYPCQDVHVGEVTEDRERDRDRCKELERYTEKQTKTKMFFEILYRLPINLQL
jgi:hypothetical protein